MGYQSDDRVGLVNGTPLGPQYTEEAPSSAYRAALGHALRGDGPRGVNLPAMIEYAAMNATDMISIQGRLSRIAAALGKHIPMKNGEAAPTAPSTSMLQQFETVNVTQRNAIEQTHSLLAEIEQALGI